MRICIVDDEAHAVDLLTKFVLETPGLELAGTFTNPVEALQILRGSDPPEIALLDVEMPGLSGLELGQLINDRVKVILVTSFNEFGPAAFDINAVDYIMKPVSYSRFYRCIEKLKRDADIKIHDVKERLVLFVKGGQKDSYLSISIAEIAYIKAALNYIEIFHEGDRIITYLTLSEISNQLPEATFCRVHRSFVLNINKIKAIDQSDVEMSDGSIIPIGDSYRENFFKRLAPLFLVSGRGRR